jgi:hypothetical protein
LPQRQHAIDAATSQCTQLYTAFFQPAAVDAAQLQFQPTPGKL